jgi:hypothetical protein
MKQPVRTSIEVIDGRSLEGEMLVNCLNESTRTLFENTSVHFRGQSSLRFSKHQLGLNIALLPSTSASASLPSVSFLRFPPGRQFVLNGPWIDGSLLRNHLAHWLFRRTGRYSPRTRHLVVYTRARATSPLEYRGIYLALEQISFEQDEERVTLARMDATCRSLTELSGGWAWQLNPVDFGAFAPNLAVDKYSLAFASGIKPRLMFPPGDALTQEMRDNFVSPETGSLPRMYRLLYENMTTSPKLLQELVDLGSFADYLLHSELSLNTDAYRKSVFFFKDRGQPINAGPVWDFNLAYGQGASDGTWLFEKFPMWARLTCHFEFAALLPKRWRELRSREWSDASILRFIDESAAPIRRQLKMLCRSQWSSADAGCANVRSTRPFEDELKLLADAVVARAQWMDLKLVHGHLFRPLDAATCGNLPTSDASPLPKFNCARDGSDSRCLESPDEYIEAARFPAPRRAYSGPQCSSAAVEEPSVDFCWLSVGEAPGLGLTSFCSGHGTCESGLGAVCQCAKGYIEPSCAASSGELSRSGMEWGWLGGQVVLWLALLVAAASLGARMSGRRGDRGHQRRGEASPVARGPVTEYGAAA